jgi:hypothetical protein
VPSIDKRAARLARAEARMMLRHPVEDAALT